MRKPILVLSIILAAGGARAQDLIVPASEVLDFNVNQNFTEAPNNNRFDDTVWFSPEGSWAQNWTVRDGSGYFLRGEGLNLNTVTLWLTNDLRGRITQALDRSNSRSLPFQRTTIYSSDETEINGYTADFRANRVVHAPVHVENARDPYLGNWTFVEGNYIAPDEGVTIPENQGGGTRGFNGATFIHVRSLIVSNASFYGSNVTSSRDVGTTMAGGSGIQMFGVGASTTEPGFSGNGKVEFYGDTGIQVKPGLNDEIVGGHSGNILLESKQNTVTFNDGGEGVYIFAQGITDPEINVYGGNYFGGGNEDRSAPRSNRIFGFNAQNNFLRGEGGSAMVIRDNAGGTFIYDGVFVGGDAGSTEAVGRNTFAYSFGGYGLFNDNGAIDVLGGHFVGGRASSAKVNTFNEVVDEVNGGTIVAGGNGIAYAYGGHGIASGGGSDIRRIFGGTSFGGAGGLALALGTNCQAYAQGGSGVYQYENSSLTIGGGMFQGGDGGYAFVSDDDPGNIAVADGGSGVYMGYDPVFGDPNRLDINGGVFRGGKAGTAVGPNTSSMRGAGIWLVQGDLFARQIQTNEQVLVDGDVVHETPIPYVPNVTNPRKLEFESGTINGNIIKLGPGFVDVKLGETNNAPAGFFPFAFNGSYIHKEGFSQFDQKIHQSSKYLKDVIIESGVFKFTQRASTNAVGSRYVLKAADCFLDFDRGAYLSENSTISAGYGTVAVTGRNGTNITMGADSSISLATTD